jgi:hypothetical protein
MLNHGVKMRQRVKPGLNPCALPKQPVSLLKNCFNHEKDSFTFRFERPRFIGTSTNFY